MELCSINPASEDYADFIYSHGNVSDLFYSQSDLPCVEFVSTEYAILYSPLTPSLIMSLANAPYYTIPKLYTLMDTSSMEAAGIIDVAANPSLNANGEHVIIGFIDTGIDYQNPLFRNEDGTTRLVGIWDQTLPGPDQLPPGIPAEEPLYSISYGTGYTPEQINQALASDDPLSIVPSTDTNGHGTFLAGIAAGSSTANGDFIGAAPRASIAVVKLKPAKQYLRDYYCICKDAVAYQENDIMMGIKYLRLISRKYTLPLVICLGLGTNYGNHDGSSPLGHSLTLAARYRGLVNVVAAGNETGLAHHYYGAIPSGQDMEDVEIRVAEGERGFVVELWTSAADIYNVGFISPGGETIDRIPIITGNENRISFLLEPTVIIVSYQTSETVSGRQLIFMRFQRPTAGVWRIRVYNTLYLLGRYHMWLPVQGFISDQTVFLNPNPYTTITEPGNSPSVITVGAYDPANGSIYIHSGRGYTLSGLVKPDLAAPGVSIYGPALPGPYRAEDSIPMTRRTGTSVAAAHVAGAAADLLSWSLRNGELETMSQASITGYLIRGASRNPSYTYPNREWGYGTLNLYQSFLNTRT